MYEMNRYDKTGPLRHPQHPIHNANCVCANIEIKGIVYLLPYLITLLMYSTSYVDN